MEVFEEEIFKSMYIICNSSTVDSFFCSRKVFIQDFFCFFCYGGRVLDSITIIIVCLCVCRGGRGDVLVFPPLPLYQSLVSIVMLCYYSRKHCLCLTPSLNTFVLGCNLDQLVNM